MPFFDTDFTTLPNNKATKLANITCAYCGGEAEPDNPLTDEHVIGRKFVPKGSFAKGWSLILRACERCNNKKSDLEDEISAITMLPDLGTAHEQPDLFSLAARKAAKARSRLTKKTVANSYEDHVVEGKLMSAIDCRFGFTAPPRLAQERVMRLARFHLQGFFDISRIWDALDKIRAKHPDMVLLHGGSPRGAERIAACWADNRKVPQVVFKPDWNRDRNAAPFKRNDRLLEVLPIGVVVFPGSGISANLADKAKKLGIPVWRFDKRASAKTGAESGAT